MAAKTDLTKETGASGTNISQGIISGEEYNPKLTGANALKAYDEMRRSDATVKAALRAVKLPIKSAEYRIDAAADDENRVVANVVHKSLFEFVNWKKFLNEALTHLDFGFTVFEMVFEPRYIDGKLRLALVKLGFRKPTTIQAWETEDHQPGVTQLLPMGKTVSIPIEKLLVFTNDEEGDNFQGISLLRSAYKHYYIKDRLYRIDAVGNERQALGVLDITIPKGADPKDKARIRKAARNLRANESSYIDHPEGWLIQFMDMKAGTLKNVEPSISHHNRQILMNVLAQFLDFGASGAAGSRGTSEDHSRLFELGVKDIADYIVETLQNKVIKLIVDLNFNVTEYPQLQVGNISDENIPVVTAAIKALVEAGVLHPRSADENNVRKMIGWKEVDEDELDELFAEDKTKPPVVPAVDPKTGLPIEAPADEVVDENKAVAAARWLKERLTGLVYGSKKRAD